MKNRMITLSVAVVVSFISAISAISAMACTGIQLKTADGSVVHGRTLEFGMFLKTDVVLVPRGFSLTGKTPLGDGKSWQAKYAALGITVFDYPALLDGINEKGLAVGTFYFPTFAGYTKTTKENQSMSLSMSDFPNWLLTQFASVDEIRAALEKKEVAIAPFLIPGFPAEPQPFHYVVYDKKGTSIVIEPVNGELIVHENPLGVLTNSPTFDWHMTNLRNYISLDPLNVPSVKVAGKTFRQLGQGSGMLGLPGDFTPPARFVRAAVFSATAIPEKNAERGIYQTFHILNNFDIPVGIAREKAGKKMSTDYTMLTVARDPQALKFYWKTYEDQAIRSVSMKGLDLNGKNMLKISMMDKQQVIDMSSEMKQG